MDALGTGFNFSAISGTDIRDIEINIPNLLEQKKIADFLSTFDQKIENQQEQISILEEIKKGVIQKIFSQEIRFKGRNGEDFPEWEEKRVDEVFNLTRGVVIAKTTIEENRKEQQFIRFTRHKHRIMGLWLHGFI
jgi:type I restriction enzyme S subunit